MYTSSDVYARKLSSSNGAEIETTTCNLCELLLKQASELGDPIFKVSKGLGTLVCDKKKGEADKPECGDHWSQGISSLRASYGQISSEESRQQACKKLNCHVPSPPAPNKCYNSQEDVWSLCNEGLRCYVSTHMLHKNNFNI